MLTKTRQAKSGMSPAAAVGEPASEWTPAIRCVGWLVSIDAQGRATVDFSGNSAGPLLARSVVGLSRGELVAAGPRPALLLDFEASDANRPLIIGILRDRLVQAEPGLAATARIDGRCVEITAARELTLQCGLASIVLHADGRIVIQGGELQSRASGLNRIIGSSVSIN